MPTPFLRPRPARARSGRRLFATSILAGALLGTVVRADPDPTPASGAASAAAPVSVCAGDASCTEVSAFAMSVVEFRVSLQGAWKVLTTTLRFRNKLNRPLALGYVLGSGGATDDRGNRYVVKDGDIRGIGFISAQPDAKFVMAPGETGDARFTLVWGGQGIFGTTFDLDLTVREIVQVGNGQTTLGPEYPLQIVGLVDGARSAGPGVAQAPGTAPATGSAPTTGAAPASTPSQPAPGGAPPAQTASPFGLPAPAGGARCAAGTACYDAGSFTVTLGQTATAVSGKNQLVRLGLRVKNQTNQPLVLGYKAGTSAAVDEQGNRFTWGQGAHDASAQGIGTLEGTRIDPQFQVAPGGTRDMQMVLTRFNATTPVGKTFTLDTVLVELKGAGQQWQKGRENAVHLANPGAVATPAGGQNPGNDQVQKASDLLRGLLGGK